MLAILAFATVGAAAVSPVRQVSYSTGQKGSQLKWLPYHGASGGGVEQALATEPLAGPKLAAPNTPGPTTAPPDRVGEPAEKPLASPAPAKPLTGNAKAAVAPALKTELPKPTLETAAAPPQEGCPPLDQMRPIREARILERIPPAPGMFPQICSMTRDVYEPRAWAPITFRWTASALCSKPVYFEDPHLERYGHMWGPYLQPFMSAGHFFLAVPALPYLAGLYPPHECIYTLGYYRPGSCAPYLLDPLPLSVRAALVEGSAATGLVFLIP
jgi:hypothetical protein